MQYKWWCVRLSRVPFSSLDPLPIFIQCALVDHRRYITVRGISLSWLRWWHLTALADSVQTILLWHVRTNKDRCRSCQATIVQCTRTGPQSPRVSAPMLRDTASFPGTGILTPVVDSLKPTYLAFWLCLLVGVTSEQIRLAGALLMQSWLDLTWLYMTLGDL